jgi:hypothetical protein
MGTGGWIIVSRKVYVLPFSHHHKVFVLDGSGVLILT